MKPFRLKHKVAKALKQDDETLTAGNVKTLKAPKQPRTSVGPETPSGPFALKKARRR